MWRSKLYSVGLGYSPAAVFWEYDHERSWLIKIGEIPWPEEWLSPSNEKLTSMESVNERFIYSGLKCPGFVQRWENNVVTDHQNQGEWWDGLIT
jgi:hypothetical protein